jgi:TPP-dependent pyruvate/acetoin dehydrogenase alpha subunit
VILALKNLDAASLERIYSSLRLIRRAEEEIARAYPSDVIKSPVHLSIGEEAIAVGVADVLTEQDAVAGSYRGHALYLAKGASLRTMMAELYGKQTGCAAGKGGSMHLIAPEKNVLGASAIVATQIPQAVGYALALKREGRGRMIAVFFGDGATEEGVFYESLNFAALRKLPILFVCENNQYAIHAPLEKRWATRKLCQRVATYDIPAYQTTDDVLRIRELAEEAAASIRAGNGPFFIECLTYRWREHVGPHEDYDAGYRSRDELVPWEARDQIPKLGEMLDPARKAAIDLRIETEIADAIAYAELSQFPIKEELYTHVFAK